MSSKNVIYKLVKGDKTIYGTYTYLVNYYNFKSHIVRKMIKGIITSYDGWRIVKTMNLDKWIYRNLELYHNSLIPHKIYEKIGIEGIKQELAEEGYDCNIRIAMPEDYIDWLDHQEMCIAEVREYYG